MFGATTDADGNAFFNIRVPARAAAGAASLQGADSSGNVIFNGCFTVTGRAVHPATG